MIAWWNLPLAVSLASALVIILTCSDRTLPYRGFMALSMALVAIVPNALVWAFGYFLSTMMP